MTTEAALLAGIDAAPDEDTPRLVYADWLDDSADTVECPVGRGTGDNDPRLRAGRCFPECPTCHGWGAVSDGRKERAELIRVQVAYERGPFDTVTLSPEREHIITRSRQLSLAVGEWEFSGLPIEVCPTPFLRAGGRFWATHRGPAVAYFRGLPEARLTLAQLMGGGCISCSLDARREPNPRCRRCSGTGRTPGLAAALGKVVGLTGVTLGDASPNTRSIAGRASWYFHDGTGRDHPHWLPLAFQPIMLQLAPGADWHMHWTGSHPSVVEFRGEAAERDAVAALSAAALALCRLTARESAGAASNSN